MCWRPGEESVTGGTTDCTCPTTIYSSGIGMYICAAYMCKVLSFTTAAVARFPACPISLGGKSMHAFAHECISGAITHFSSWKKETCDLHVCNVLTASQAINLARMISLKLGDHRNVY